MKAKSASFIVLILLVLLSSTSLWATQSKSEDPFVYKTKHQGYTCERWGKQGYKESDFETEWAYKFESLEISKSTRKAKISITSLLPEKSKCLYTAYFSRKKGNTFVTFEGSTVNGSQFCQSIKEDLDAFLEPGWDYKIKMNKYLSVKFATEIPSKCTPQSGESYARFFYDILG